MDKAKSALQSTSSDELVQRHAAALTALRTELKAKHESEIKALKETLASQTAVGEQQTAVDTALAEQKQALKEVHNKEIEAARESGRMEAAMKIKLKDSQLTKSAKRVKDLEGQIREWEASGKLPANSLGGIGQNPTLSSVPTASTSSVTAGTKPTVPTAVGTRPAAPVAVAKPSPQAALAVAGPSGPVRKPVPAGTAARAPVRGRGQPSRPLPTKPVTTPGGISIAGAAAAAAASTAGPKRPREDADTTGSDDSLAKRLKSAEPVASTAPAIGAKPVQLRRPPPGP